MWENDGLPNKYPGYKQPVLRGKNFAGSILMSYIKINLKNSQNAPPQTLTKQIIKQ